MRTGKNCILLRLLRRPFVRMEELSARHAWRRQNAHNGTSMVRRFDPSLVSVGRATYGPVDVIASTNEAKLRIGCFCSIAEDVRFILSSEHPTDNISTFPFKVKIGGARAEAATKGDIVVDDDVWIGQRATILSGVHISQGAVIAAGAVVTRDVPPYAICGGVPAKLIKYRFDPPVIEKLLRIDFSRLSDDTIRGSLGRFYETVTAQTDLGWLPQKARSDEMNRPLQGKGSASAMKDKVLVGIVTYDPDIQLLRENLTAAHAQIENVFIWDNASAGPAEICAAAESVCGGRATVHMSDKNVGIAGALNGIMRFALAGGYQWVLTLDQDSVIPADLMSRFSRYMSDDKVAIICPRMRDRNIDDAGAGPAEECEQINACITSGGLTNVSIWDEVGGFDEQMFIDEVDHDYNATVRERGYKILRINSVVLSHAIGKSEVRRLFGRRFIVYHHPAWRKYYQIRNMLYLSRKHYGHITLHWMKCICLTFLTVVLWEDNRAEKFKACVRGLRDAGKMELSRDETART